MWLVWYSKVHLPIEGGFYIKFTSEHHTHHTMKQPLGRLRGNELRQGWLYSSWPPFFPAKPQIKVPMYPGTHAYTPERFTKAGAPDKRPTFLPGLHR